MNKDKLLKVKLFLDDISALIDTQIMQRHVFEDKFRRRYHDIYKLVYKELNPNLSCAPSPMADSYAK